MPFMSRIPSDLAKFGLRVELVPGWATRGSSSFAPGCVVDHWTAGPRGTTGRPSLNVVVNGRTGLAGPLANVYLARDGVCVVTAAGRANHAGLGGFRGLVGNSAAYGIEAECAGDGDWTPAQLDAYPRLNAALLSGIGRDASWVCGHNEWAPTRKIDIRDVIGSVRARTAAVLANPTRDWFDMATREDLRAVVANEVRAIHDTLTPGVPRVKFDGQVYAWIRDTAARTAALEVAVRALAETRDDDIDVDALLARIENIVQANRAQLNVEVTPGDAPPAA